MNELQTHEVEKMISEGRSQGTVLRRIVKTAESFIRKNEVCSILVIDENGLLRNGASPGLPADYLAAIDKLKPDSKIGTCASAAATGQMVITPDFLADDKWSELKHLPISLGYVGAWSVPVKDAQGKVLGTLGIYLRNKRNPKPEEIKKLEHLSALAALVLSSAPIKIPLI